MLAGNRYSVRVVDRPYHYFIDAAQRDLNFSRSIELLAGLKHCPEALKP